MIQKLAEERESHGHFFAGACIGVVLIRGAGRQRVGDGHPRVLRVYKAAFHPQLPKTLHDGITVLPLVEGGKVWEELGEVAFFLGQLPH